MEQDKMLKWGRVAVLGWAEEVDNEGCPLGVYHVVLGVDSNGEELCKCGRSVDQLGQIYEFRSGSEDINPNMPESVKECCTCVQLANRIQYKLNMENPEYAAAWASYEKEMASVASAKSTAARGTDSDNSLRSAATPQRFASTILSRVKSWLTAKIAVSPGKGGGE